MAPVAAFAVVSAGVFGLLIGSFLNVVVYRVPAGTSLLRPSRCPQCDADVKPWQNVPVLSWVALRGRCASCDAPISGRYPLVEAATGLAFAAVTWLFVSTWMQSTGSAWLSPLFVLLAYLYFAAISIALTLIDLDVHRLPNAIVMPSYVVAGALFSLACVFGADWSQFLRAAIGGAAMFAFYFVVRLVRPDGMGGGDVKLAGIVGLYLGWVGWGALAFGAFAAFLFAGVFGIALIASRRADRKSAIPFGPWMLAGGWAGVLIGEAVGSLYVGLYAAR